MNFFINVGDEVKFKKNVGDFSENDYGKLVEISLNLRNEVVYFFADKNAGKYAHIKGIYDVTNSVEVKEPMEVTLASIVADCINSYSFDYKKFAEAMGTEHRTLQQSFTRLCVRWLEHLSNQQNFDGRNEASVRLARTIFCSIPEDYLYLPLV